MDGTRSKRRSRKGNSVEHALPQGVRKSKSKVQSKKTSRRLRDSRATHAAAEAIAAPHIATQRTPPVSPRHFAFHSLPLFPELVFVKYDSDLGDQVCQRYQIVSEKDEYARGLRIIKYGPEAAAKYSPGATPAELREEYDRIQDEALRQYELSDGSDDEHEPPADLHHPKSPQLSPTTHAAAEAAPALCVATQYTAPLSPRHFDFHLLPFRPEIAMYQYQPDFGDQVCRRYESIHQLDELKKKWRANKYGAAVVAQYSPGATPIEVQEAYNRRQEEALRRWEGVEEYESPEPEDEDPANLVKDPWLSLPPRHTRRNCPRLNQGDSTAHCCVQLALPKRI